MGELVWAGPGGAQFKAREARRGDGNALRCRAFEPCLRASIDYEELALGRRPQVRSDLVQGDDCALLQHGCKVRLAIERWRRLILVYGMPLVQPGRQATIKHRCLSVTKGTQHPPEPWRTEDAFAVVADDVIAAGHTERRHAACEVIRRRKHVRQATGVVGVIEIEEPCPGDAACCILATSVAAHGREVPRSVNDLDGREARGQPACRDERWAFHAHAGFGGLG